MTSTRNRIIVESTGFRDTAEQWAALKDRCVVDRETLRDRMRRGWALETALVMPKAWRRPVIARIRVIVRQSPGITFEGVRAAVPDMAPSIVERTLGREVTAGRLRVEAGAVPRYWVVAPGDAPRQRGRPHVEDAWTPAAWLHPIRAAATMPVAMPVRRAADVRPLDYADPRRGA